jgi:hypothetical protein
MLNKYSLLMMMLLIAGSLVGISSIYTPANVVSGTDSELIGCCSISSSLLPFIVIH